MRYALLILALNSSPASAQADAGFTPPEVSIARSDGTACSIDSVTITNGRVVLQGISNCGPDYGHDQITGVTPNGGVVADRIRSITINNGAPSEHAGVVDSAVRHCASVSTQRDSYIRCLERRLEPQGYVVREP